MGALATVVVCTAALLAAAWAGADAPSYGSAVGGGANDTSSADGTARPDATNSTGGGGGAAAPRGLCVAATAVLVAVEWLAHCSYQL